VSGQAILEASFTSKRVTRQGFAATSNALRNTVIQKMERRGKHILIHLNRGLLHVHLGMTGKLLWNAAPTPYTRAVIELSNGMLVYDDVRQFGRVEFYSVIPKNITALGPEPLDITFEQFEERLHARGLRVKALLLDQRFLAGVGNIYADEALFAAGIHPSIPANRLSRKRARRLYDSIRSVLELAISLRGSSISDYVDGSGARGEFQTLHQVYGRTGLPCAHCGRPIRRIVIAQRGTHFCPACQRL
jgi:formamidopyrimidine-DNA glycosylase